MINKATPRPKTIRCAIYTRKSTEEGLDQQYNSLDSQRDAGESYIRSQANEGWELVPDRYDDGGFSGGNIERPALKRMMEDIQAGKDRLCGRLQGRSTQPIVARLRPRNGDVRQVQRFLRLRDSAFQHNPFDGPANTEHPTFVCPIRTRDHRRTHP
jgi:Resolvase, N terminal domain